MITDSCVSIPFGDCKQLKMVTVACAWQQNLVEKEIMIAETGIMCSLFFLLYPQGASPVPAVESTDVLETIPRTRKSGKLDCCLG